MKGGQKDKEISFIVMIRVQYVMKGAVCDEAYNHGLSIMNRYHIEYGMRGERWIERQRKQLYSDEKGSVCDEGCSL